MIRFVHRWCVSYLDRVNQPAVPKAPLHPLPLMEALFERIGMDLIGPFQWSVHRHRFLLVVDYATRYPEAVPLRTICVPLSVSHHLFLFLPGHVQSCYPIPDSTTGK